MDAFLINHIAQEVTFLVGLLSDETVGLVNRRGCLEGTFMLRSMILDEFSHYATLKEHYIEGLYGVD